MKNILLLTALLYTSLALAQEEILTKVKAIYEAPSYASDTLHNMRKEFCRLINDSLKVHYPAKIGLIRINLEQKDSDLVLTYACEIKRCVDGERADTLVESYGAIRSNQFMITAEWQAYMGCNSEQFNNKRSFKKEQRKHGKQMRKLAGVARKNTTTLGWVVVFDAFFISTTKHNYAN